MKTLFGLTAVTLFLFTSLQAKPLNVGDDAPEVSSLTDTGKKLELGKVYKKGPTLVYFYPKSFTGGCTKQACNLRDHFADLTDKGLRVIGVSIDDVETQAAFRKEHNLPFTLLADTENEVGKAFGVDMIRDGTLHSRQSFLIVDGKITWRDLKATPVTQAQDALAALESSS